MTVHLTNLHGMAPSSVAQIAQNMVMQIAHDNLHFKECGIYFYDNSHEKAKERNARFDGIIASVGNKDTLIMQAPSWNGIAWDNAFIDHLGAYDLKKIIFIEDVPPLMFKTDAPALPEYINYFNKADLLIVPSQNLYNYLRKNGLKEKPIVIQTMWDHLCRLNLQDKPKNSRFINFAGNPRKFTFVRDWASNTVKLNVYGAKASENSNPHVNYLGWYEDDDLLKALRRKGGFGLVWSEEPYWRRYMTMNASYKLSTYLAAGLPVIVNGDSPVKNIILQKHLGIVIDNINQAIQTIANISDFEYQVMQKSVDSFAELIRKGYFTKRALVEAVFKARYE